MSQSTQSTQYDNIGLAYESMKRLPPALLEKQNLQSTLTPWIAGAKILDLACGTGYYSRLLLSWGAEKVVGVDISPKMVEAAQASSQSQGIGDDRLSFHVGDATRPLPLAVTSQGPFDIVLGAWLLNYASSASEMSMMFSNASSSLASGGRFVGIAPPPAPDLDAFAAAHATPQAKAEMRRFGVTVEYLSPLENGEGYRTRVTANTEPVEVSFRNFHLKNECFESAARQGGMHRSLEWREVVLPDEQSDKMLGVDERCWEGYHERPHFAILVVEK